MSRTTWQGSVSICHRHPEGGRYRPSIEDQPRCTMCEREERAANAASLAEMQATVRRLVEPLSIPGSAGNWVASVAGASWALPN